VRPSVPKKHFVCLVKNSIFARAWKLRFLEQLQYCLCADIEQHSALGFNFDSGQLFLDVLAHRGMGWDVFLRRVSWRDHQVIHLPVL
jgi:hypothetical protein